MGVDVDAARTFIYTNARLVEQLAYAACFEGADPNRLVAAVAAYQNDDGGFGHGLEPDKRCHPASRSTLSWHWSGWCGSGQRRLRS